MVADAKRQDTFRPVMPQVRCRGLASYGIEVDLNFSISAKPVGHWPRLNMHDLIRRFKCQIPYIHMKVRFWLTLHKLLTHHVGFIF